MTYTVKIKPHNHVLYVEKDETVLDAALRQDYIFPYSCQSGICGTCMGKILHGNIHYPDMQPEELSATERAEGYALFCSAVPTSNLVIEVNDVIAPDQLKKKQLNYHISAIKDLSSNTLQVLLMPPSHDYINYIAGQYVYIFNTQGEKRPYSIANAQHSDHHIELHIRHTPDNDFSEQLLIDLQQQQTLPVEGAYGYNIFHTTPKVPTLLLAAGTGFAYIKAIIEASIQAKFSQPLHLYWGAKTEHDLYMHEKPLQWQKSLPNFAYTAILSNHTGDNWTGKVGYVHHAVCEDYEDLSAFQVFAGGPPNMVLAALDTLQQQGLKKTWMFSDVLEYSE